MPESFDFARDALARTEDAWGRPRVDALLERTHERIAAHRRSRRIGLSLAACLVVGVGLGAAAIWRGALETRVEGHDDTLAEHAVPGASAAGWTMEVGGSHVALVGDGTDVRALPDEGSRAGLELISGAIEVDGVALRVLVADQQLVIERARFGLSRVGAGFEVRVDAGEVRFGDRTIAAGGRLVFDPAAAPAIPAPAVVAPEVVASDEAPSRPRAEAKPKWRALVRARDWAEAYTEMKRADPKTVRASVDALMAAADAARFGGHPSEAPEYLSEVIDAHARHAMAPLAAFTLGRVRLEQLGAPADAARAFAKARALDPSGALAADALAREVEAWAKAGQLETARSRARAYLEAYPDGRRVAAVRRHAELPAP